MEYRKETERHHIEIGKPFNVFGYNFILKTPNKLLFISENTEILAKSQEYFFFEDKLMNHEKTNNTIKSTACICGRVFYIQDNNLFLAGTPDGKGRVIISTQLN